MQILVDAQSYSAPVPLPNPLDCVGGCPAVHQRVQHTMSDTTGTCLAGPNVPQHTACWYRTAILDAHLIIEDPSRKAQKSIALV